MFDELSPYMKSLEPVPHELMVQCLRELDEFSQKDRLHNVADELLPSASNYLTPWEIKKLVRDEISVEQASELIDVHRAFIDRACVLVPVMLSMLGVSDGQSMKSSLMQIRDACHEYDATIRSESAKQETKKTIANLVEIQEHVQNLIELLDARPAMIDIEFDEQFRESSEVRSPSTRPEMQFWQLVDALGQLDVSAKLIVHGHESGFKRIYASGNRPKVVIVRWAFHLALYRGKPKLVTTPGSEFSQLCTLWFELASGISDESLEGVINRFARSEERKKTEEEEVQRRLEESAAQNEIAGFDNFYSVKENIKRHEKQIGFFEQMLVSNTWSGRVQSGVNDRIQFHKKMVERETARVGPFLLWANQIAFDKNHIPVVDSDTVSHNRIDEFLMDIDIAIGQIQRARKQEDLLKIKIGRQNLSKAISKLESDMEQS